jgi:hypothetical protein
MPIRQQSSSRAKLTSVPWVAPPAQNSTITRFYVRVMRWWVTVGVGVENSLKTQQKVKTQLNYNNFEFLTFFRFDAVMRRTQATGVPPPHNTLTQTGSTPPPTHALMTLEVLAVSDGGHGVSCRRPRTQLSGEKRAELTWEDGRVSCSVLVATRHGRRGCVSK